MTVSIADLDRGAVVAALYNASRPLGMGFMQYDPTPMTAKEGNSYAYSYIDYLKGRVMKLDFNSVKDELDVRLYDRDNGEGKAAQVIAALRAESTVDNEATRSSHKAGVVESAKAAMDSMEEDHTESETDFGGTKVKTITIGLKDMKDHLAPKVAKALEG